MSINERTINIYFDNLINALSDVDYRQFINSFLEINVIPNNYLRCNCYAKPFVTIPDGYIDEVLSIDGNYGIVIELKTKWKTSPGQLNHYYEFATKKFKYPTIILISDSSEDKNKKGIAELFVDEQWKHKTWKQLAEYLKLNNYEDKYSESTALLNALLENGLLIDRKKNKKSYSLNPLLPDNYTLNTNNLEQDYLAKDGRIAIWNTAEKFWEDVVREIWNANGGKDFYCYRRDIYHFMFRWAFIKKNIFIDMRKDNYWEYYQQYYEENIKGKEALIPHIVMSKWYNMYLLIRKNRYVKFSKFSVGVINCDGVDCYFVTESLQNQRLELFRCCDAFRY